LEVWRAGVPNGSKGWVCQVRIP